MTCFLGNPFKPSKSLTDLSGVTHVSDRVLHDLLQAEKIVKNQLQEFIAERIESNKKSFYTPIKQNKLKTFSSLRISKDVKVNEKNSHCKIELSSVTSIYDDSTITTSQHERCCRVRASTCPLAKPNGEMWSTPKSKIIKDIEKEIPFTISLPENSV